jgi:excisionase family DNA binding protein
MPNLRQERKGAQMYYTPKEAAPQLTVSYWTVLRMIERRQLRAFKVGDRYRIAQAEIDRVMRQSQR